MKRALLLLAAFVWFVQMGAATQPCLPGTLASYIALGSSGCSIGTFTVVNFTYMAKASGGAAKIPPDKIQVNPIFTVPATVTLGFSAAWQVSSGQSQDSIVRYTMVPSSTTGSANLVLQLGQAKAASFGDVEIGEMTTAGNLRVFTKCGEVACQTKNQDQLTFSPVTAGLQVVDHVKLTALTTGSASLSGFIGTFDYCPPCL